MQLEGLARRPPGGGSDLDLATLDPDLGAAAEHLAARLRSPAATAASEARSAAAKRTLEVAQFTSGDSEIVMALATPTGREGLLVGGQCHRVRGQGLGVAPLMFATIPMLFAQRPIAGRSSSRQAAMSPCVRKSAPSSGRPCTSAIAPRAF